jgi:hypothetical protein
MLLSARLPPRGATRPAPPLPGGKRLAAWVIVNIEEWDELAPMPRRVNALPTGGEPSPDVPNWCWHEYGNRVGFWRLLEILDEAGCACGLAINGSAVETYRDISQAALDRGWEFRGTAGCSARCSGHRTSARKSASPPRPSRVSPASRRAAG